MKGLDSLDNVIQIIRDSSSNAAASATLRNGKLSRKWYKFLYTAGDLFLSWVISTYKTIVLDL